MELNSRNSQKFSHANVSRYTVYLFYYLFIIIMLYKEVQNEVKENSATINQSNFLKGYQ